MPTPQHCLIEVFDDSGTELVEQEGTLSVSKDIIRQGSFRLVVPDAAGASPPCLCLHCL